MAYNTMYFEMQDLCHDRKPTEGGGLCGYEWIIVRGKTGSYKIKQCFVYNIVL